MGRTVTASICPLDLPAKRSKLCQGNHTTVMVSNTRCCPQAPVHLCEDRGPDLRRCRLRRRDSGLFASSRLSTAFISIMRLSCRKQHSVNHCAADHAISSSFKRCNKHHIATQALLELQR